MSAPIDTAVDADEPVVWKKGDKGRVTVRTQALDPYSREYVYIFAHTPFTVVPDHDKRRMPEGHVTVLLRSADNGGGRIIEIPTESLEHS